MRDFLQQIQGAWTPHPGQREFLLSEASTKVLACGRRWGKTDACAILLLHGLDQPGRSRRLILAPTIGQAKLLFFRVVELYEAIGGSPVSPSSLRLGAYPRLRMNGHELIARSGHQPISLRGLEATHIVVDEAAFVRDGLVTDIAAPMLATTEGTLVLISTPNGRNAFWRYFQFGQDGAHGIWSRSGPSVENPRVSASYLESQRALISERAFRVEYEAQFLEIAGAVFRADALEQCLSASIQAKPGARTQIGVDWGRTRDYSAYAVAQVQDGLVVLVEADRLDHAGWEVQTRQVARVADRYPKAPLVCDGTAGQTGINSLLRERVPGRAVVDFAFTAQSKEALVDRLVWLVEQARLRIPPNPALKDEFLAYQYRETASGNVRTEAATGHDDLVMAVGLACRGLGSGGSGIIVGSPR